jgi:hypothetical protein
VSEREAITRRLNLAIGEARGDTFREEIAEPLAFAHALVSAAAVVAAGLVPS